MFIRIILLVVSGVLAAGVFEYCRLQAKAKDGESKIWMALAGLVVVLALPWGWYFFIYNSDENIAERRAAAESDAQQQAKADCEDPWNAFWVSKDFVGKQLKAPKTAEFPSSLNDAGVKTNYLGQCTHEVWSYVDAQNSFGATVRTNYYVKVQNRQGTDKWQLLDIQM